MEICKSERVGTLVALAMQKIQLACVTCVGNVTCNTKGVDSAVYILVGIVLLLKQNGCAGAHARSFPGKFSSLRPWARFRGFYGG